MRAKSIVIGEHYHIKGGGSCWATPIAFIQSNTSDEILVQCEWKLNKDDTFGFIKNFRPRDFLNHE